MSGITATRKVKYIDLVRISTEPDNVHFAQKPLQKS